MPCQRLVVQLSLLTPAVTGGAFPDRRAELRPSTFKSLMRWWYRASDPEYARLDREQRLFGTACNEGAQALLHVRLLGRRDAEGKWDREPFGQPPFQNGQENGFKYLGFPFFLPGGTERRWMPPTNASTCRLRLALAPAATLRDAQAVIAALWLLVHFGSIGSRSRRGFGTLWCDEIVEREGFDAVDRLPLVPAGETSTDRAAALGAGLATIREWLSNGVPAAHAGNFPTIGPGFGAWICRQPTRAGANQPPPWQIALRDLGLRLQRFRTRGVGAPPNDYTAVRDHLRWLGASAIGAPLTAAPARSAFGLPLKFRYSDRSVPNGPREIEFVPHANGDTRGRWTSPLILRVVRIGTGLHQMVVRLDAPLPGSTGVTGVTGVPTRNGRLPRPLPGPPSTALDDFVRGLSAPGWIPVS